MRKLGLVAAFILGSAVACALWVTRPQPDRGERENPVSNSHVVEGSEKPLPPMPETAPALERVPVARGACSHSDLLRQLADRDARIEELTRECDVLRAQVHLSTQLLDRDVRALAESPVVRGLPEDDQQKVGHLLRRLGRVPRDDEIAGYLDASRAFDVKYGEIGAKLHGQLSESPKDPSRWTAHAEKVQLVKEFHQQLVQVFGVVDAAKVDPMEEGTSK